jgi:hypothetical protein
VSMSRRHQMAKLANAVIATKQPEPDRAARLGLACLDLARHTGSRASARSCTPLM